MGLGLEENEKIGTVCRFHPQVSAEKQQRQAMMVTSANRCHRSCRRSSDAILIALFLL